MLVRSHAQKEKKKKEGYTTESRLAAIVLGLKKMREKRRMFIYIYMNTCLPCSTDSDNKINQ